MNFCVRNTPWENSLGARVVPGSTLAGPNMVNSGMLIRNLDVTQVSSDGEIHKMALKSSSVFQS